MHLLASSNGPTVIHRSADAILHVDAVGLGQLATGGARHSTEGGSLRAVARADARTDGFVGFVGRGPAQQNVQVHLVPPQQVESLDAPSGPRKARMGEIGEGLITIN